MSQKKIFQSLSDYLKLFPEGVLLKWLQAKHKEHIRKLSKEDGTDLERQANQKLKAYTQDDLERLRKSFLK